MSAIVVRFPRTPFGRDLLKVALSNDELLAVQCDGTCIADLDWDMIADDVNDYFDGGKEAQK